jgi:hypothetical protein
MIAHLFTLVVFTVILVITQFFVDDFVVQAGIAAVATVVILIPIDRKSKP